MIATAVESLLARVRAILEFGGLDSAEIESRRLLESVTGTPWIETITRGEVEPDVARRALELAERRAAGEPLQYVTGRAGWRFLDLEVGPGVFIPRPETELVAERAMELLPRGGTVVDVGAGSGAIGLAIATERPDSRVLATENSPRALAWARRNIAHATGSVELIECDLLEGLPGDLRGSVDVVVSNPPYIPTPEASMLPVEVVVHEPATALFAGPTGLEVVSRLVARAGDWLAPGGWLVLEIGEKQRAEIVEMLTSAGYLEVEVAKDLAGRARIASARRPDK